MKLLQLKRDMKIKHGVSSKRYEGGDFFLRKALHERTDFLRKVYRGLFYIGTNDQIMQEVGESFTNEFSSNLNTGNLKIFSGHGGRNT